MANRFVIEVRAKGFGNLDNQLKKADTSMRRFGAGSQRAGKHTDTLRKNIALARNNLLLYAFALGSVTKTMGGFIKSASDLQENVSQFGVVFGDSSNEAMQFAETLSTTFKRSKSDIIALMASLQDTFVPLGFSREEASKLSKALTQLSFDVGSFKNASAPEVSHAFTSAIVGNHEAVRKFGISITEAELKQEMLRMGMTATNGQFTSQQKVLARTSMIIKSSDDAIGDTLKTQHEFANRVREVKAQFKDLGEEVGKTLIPIAEFILDLSDTEHLKGYATGIGVATAAYIVYRRQAIAASIATANFKISLVKTGFGAVAVALGEVAARTIFAGEETKNTTGELLDLRKTMEEFSKDEESNGLSYFQQMAHIMGKDGVRALLEEYPEKIDKVAEHFQKMADLSTDIEELNQVMEDEQEHLNQFNEMFNESVEGFEAGAEAYSELNQELSKGDAARTEAQILKTAAGFKQFSDNIGKAVVEGQALGPAVINSLQAIAAELAAQAVSFAILNMITSGGASASDMGFKMLGGIIGHSGGAITSNGVQKFASGGMVGGGDNVPILAQSGEFIMKRDAVESIGLDTLATMNQTGATQSNISVNIQGGVVQEDYVRNELIPALNKQGANIA